MPEPRFLTADNTEFQDGQAAIYHADENKLKGGSVLPGPLQSISDTEIITDLEINTATEITVPHSEEADFTFCEYPRITGPEGVRVTVLALRSNGDATNGAQWVALVENIGYTAAYGGYGYGSKPDVVLHWTRKGIV